jgi:hypothetical protein
MACGLFRSGTNYLQQLLDLNFNLDPLPPRAYKHAMTEEQLSRCPSSITIALTYKSLLKWVDSQCRNSFDLIDEFELSYVAGNIPITIVYKEDSCPDDDPIPVQVSLNKLIKVYHDHYSFWKGRQWPGGIYWFSHKKLAFHPKEELQRFGMPMNFMPVVNVKHSTLFNRNLYQDDEATEFLNKEQIEFIKQNDVIIEELQ